MGDCVQRCGRESMVYRIMRYMIKLLHHNKEEQRYLKLVATLDSRHRFHGTQSKSRSYL